MRSPTKYRFKPVFRREAMTVPLHSFLSAPASPGLPPILDPEDLACSGEAFDRAFCLKKVLTGRLILNKYKLSECLIQDFTQNGTESLHPFTQS